MPNRASSQVVPLPSYNNQTGNPPSNLHPLSFTPPTPLAPSKLMSLEDLLNAGNDDMTERWLVQKNRLDFGPFCLADLKQQLYKKQFSGDDMVLNQETGELIRIRHLPILRDFILQLELHLETQKAVDAEKAESRKEKRRRTMVLGILAACLGILGVGGGLGAYFLTREPETREKIVYLKNPSKNREEQLKLEVTWKAEPPDQAAARNKKRIHGRKRPRGSTGKGGMQDVTHLGDATQVGGDEILSQHVVQEVMQKNFDRLKTCVFGEIRRDPSMKRVSINFAVKGSGFVSFVQVNDQGSGPFHACVLQRMQSIKFPSFDGALTRASFSMTIR